MKMLLEAMSNLLLAICYTSPEDLKSLHELGAEQTLIFQVLKQPLGFYCGWKKINRSHNRLFLSSQAVVFELLPDSYNERNIYTIVNKAACIFAIDNLHWGHCLV